ncbi:methyltransferase domain-containing protein [bacterium]|nr:methyltransferase domain-containing protein [bacterium]
MLKLHLGCGNNKMGGYVNIDLHSPVADVQHDLTQPLPYGDNSIDEITSIHLIEHFTRAEWQRIKKDWVRVLKVGGLMIIECPNFERCVKHFLDAPTIERSFWMLTIYGGQEAYGEGQLHKNGFTVERLISDLESEGMKIAKVKHKWDNIFNPDGFNIFLRAVKK